MPKKASLLTPISSAADSASAPNTSLLTPVVKPSVEQAPIKLLSQIEPEAKTGLLNKVEPAAKPNLLANVKSAPEPIELFDSPVEVAVVDTATIAVAIEETGAIETVPVESHESSSGSSQIVIFVTCAVVVVLAIVVAYVLLRKNPKGTLVAQAAAGASAPVASTAAATQQAPQSQPVAHAPKKLSQPSKVVRETRRPSPPRKPSSVAVAEVVAPNAPSSLKAPSKPKKRF